MRLKDEAQRRADSSPSAFHETFGSLDGCMLNGDREQSHRERRIRRWSLGISVALQTVLIIAMVIAPLLAKTEQITYRVTPLPPYAGQPKASQRRAPRHIQSLQPVHEFSFFSRIPPTIVTQTSPHGDTFPDDSVSEFNSTGPGNGGVIPIGDSRSGPKRPVIEHEKDPVRRVHRGIESAMLTKRVEPRYPVLAVQTRRTGRVELHAIISTDGTIQSLEVLDGDPLFVQSALDAVRQWRYRPTMLNGEPVEVDTSITVVYSLGDQQR
jgi:protein TonB